MPPIAPLDHVSVGSDDIPRAREFYRQALAPLGLDIVEEEVGRFVDFGLSSVTFSVETPVNGHRATPGNGVHVAFAAETRAHVDAFFTAAIAAGGVSDGHSGPRPDYGEHYYSAFVRDPDGNKIEAVCQSASADPRTSLERSGETPVSPPSHSVFLHYATEADAPLVAELFRQVVSKLDIYNQALRASEIEKFSGSKIATLVAHDAKAVTIARSDNVPVGFAITDDQRGPIWIEWYGVLPSVRNRGVGRAIIEYLIAAGPDRHATKLWCDTRTNNFASMALFQKLGFRRLCELKNHWYGHDFFLWEREL